MPRYRCSCFMSVGGGKSLNTWTCRFRGEMPRESTWCPKKDKEDAEKTHLAGFICRPLSCKITRTCLRWSMCSASDRLATRMSSKYTNTNGRCRNNLSISLWKVWAAFFSPNGMKRYSKRPKGVQIAVLGISALDMGI